MAEFDHAKALAHLQQKWGNRNCPMCGVGPWNIQDRTFQLMEFHQGSVMIGGPVIPVIPVTCGNCGFTVLVNAIVAKVVEPQAATSGKAE